MTFIFYSSLCQNLYSLFLTSWIPHWGHVWKQLLTSQLVESKVYFFHGHLPVQIPHLWNYQVLFSTQLFQHGSNKLWIAFPRLVENHFHGSDFLYTERGISALYKQVLKGFLGRIKPGLTTSHYMASFRIDSTYSCSPQPHSPTTLLPTFSLTNPGVGPIPSQPPVDLLRMLGYWYNILE